MKHVYEFEVFLDEGRYTVWPFDFECGGTSGATFREACEMAVDWLKTVVEDYAMHDEATPEPTFDNEPRYGGRIIHRGGVRHLGPEGGRDARRRRSAHRGRRRHLGRWR